MWEGRGGVRVSGPAVRRSLVCYDLLQFVCRSMPAREIPVYYDIAPVRLGSVLATYFRFNNTRTLDEAARPVHESSSVCYLCGPTSIYISAVFYERNDDR